MTAIDRGLAVAAFTPAGRLLGQWTFSLDETPGVQLPPTPFVLRGEVPCAVLRPGQRTDVTTVLADGSWLATVEGAGRAVITLNTPVPPSEWKHRMSNGRGEASSPPQELQLIPEPVPSTRSIFRFSMPPEMLNLGSGPVFQHSSATLEPSGITAVRVCQATILPLPATGAFEVGAERDAWFGPGWNLGERGGTLVVDLAGLTMLATAAGDDERDQDVQDPDHAGLRSPAHAPTHSAARSNTMATRTYHRNSSAGIPRLA